MFWLFCLTPYCAEIVKFVHFSHLKCTPCLSLHISMSYLDLFWYPIPHFSTWHLVQSDQGDILQSCGHGSKHISSINTETDWIKYMKIINLYEWPMLKDNCMYTSSDPRWEISSRAYALKMNRMGPTMNRMGPTTGWRSKKFKKTHFSDGHLKGYMRDSVEYVI